MLSCTRPISQAYILLIVFSPSNLPSVASERNYLSASNPNSQRPVDASIVDPSTLDLSVVIPAYNERDRLEKMVDEAMDYFSKIVLGSHQQNANADDLLLQRYSKGIELVIVDDGSTDGTTQIAVAIAQKWDKKLREFGKASASIVPIEIRVITLERNHGKGGAVRHVSLASFFLFPYSYLICPYTFEQGVLFSRGRRILFADADGASRFSDLTLLQAEMDRMLSLGNTRTNGAGEEAKEKAKEVLAHVEGQAVVVGSRAHLVKSDAVVKVRFLIVLL